MCVLKDTYLGEDYIVFREERTPSPLHLVVNTRVTTTVERSRTAAVTSYFWCRSCHSKSPIVETKSCDCGVIVCNDCLDDFEGTCPMCDSVLA